MLGIKWRDFVVYPNGNVDDGKIVVDVEKYVDVKVIFGWSKEYGFDFYVRCGDGSIFSRHGDEVKGKFVELTYDDYVEYKKIMEIAKEVEKEYKARMKEIEIVSEWFELDKDDVDYYEGYYMCPCDKSLVFIGEFPDIRTESGFDEYITEYVRVVRYLWTKWKEIVDNLEKKYQVRIVFE